MSTKLGSRTVTTLVVVTGLLVGVVFAVAVKVVGSAGHHNERGARPVPVVFVPGCCEGFAQWRLDRLAAELRDGAWRQTRWAPLQVRVNGVPQPLEGELPATAERGGVAASIRVTMAGKTATGVDVLGVDTAPDRAERVEERVQSGEGGEAVRYKTVRGCRYDIVPAALPALREKLATGGIPRVPTRLRADYTYGADWPALQQVDGRWLVSWRKGARDSAPRLLLAIEPTRDGALAKASGWLPQVQRAHPCDTTKAPGRDLNSGTRGADVALVQQWLGNVPPRKGDPPLDGVFGTSTTNSIKTFEKQHELPSTGIVDWDTWILLCGEASRHR
jgi:hypothetical protein